MDPIVIIGSGLAGYTVAREFRKLEPAASLVVVSRDEASSYSKPMLSNALAAGKGAAQIANATAAQMAEQLKARVLAGAEAASIDTAGRVLQLGGDAIRYSKLVLALGADPISVPIDGDAAADVLQVNDLAGYARFRAAIEGRKRIALLGAGLIGCEFANDLAAAGYGVEVIDPAPRPLGRLLPEVAATRVRAALEAVGVRWHFGTAASAVSRTASGLRIALANGDEIEADVVLSAIGLRPRTQLAQRAGLKTSRGIVTDRFLQTSAPEVYALGDCAEVEGRVLPFVMPIMQAARALARTLAGAPTPVIYPAMPVVVKTPAMPAVVCPPPAMAGAWRVIEDAAGVEALYEEEAGRLTGFALVGAACVRKNALANALQPD
ncbi:MAG: FAD-dependent oxidoreductase [Betaproteobacteria bacterium]|nr:MAG: FAD-dependent oxidoreductase [Betaproteobacteria bacterium]